MYVLYDFMVQLLFLQYIKLGELMEPGIQEKDILEETKHTQKKQYT